jgi:hypothetical protein
VTSRSLSDFFATSERIIRTFESETRRLPSAPFELGGLSAIVPTGAVKQHNETEQHRDQGLYELRALREATCHLGAGDSDA